MYLHCIRFKAEARFKQEFRRKREIALRGSEIDMAEVGRELRQHTLQVNATAIPCYQSMHCSSVSKIMQPRLPGRTAAMALNVRQDALSTKGVSHCGLTQ